MDKLIVTLTGPTCSGKSTLEKRLRDQQGFASLISTTTRPMRAGEVDGQSYYFVSHKEFEQRDLAGEFIESVIFNGNYYAVSAKECERAFAEGKPVVVVVEPEGFRQIQAYCKSHGWRHVGVFVDIEPQVQLNRFIGRTANDYADAAPGELIPAKEMLSLLSRLAIMNNAEQDWRKVAHAITTPYDISIGRFDEVNETFAIAKIMRFVNNTPVRRRA